MKVIQTILVHLFTGANIVTILLLWACCGSTFLHPADFPRLGLFGLAFPFLLIPNILFVFFWLIFKVKRIWLPILGLIACFPFIRAYYPINWNSEMPDSTALSILSYNACGYGRGQTAPKSKQDCIAYLAGSGADIICIHIIFHPGIGINLIFHIAALLLLFASQCLNDHLIVSTVETVGQL